MEAISAEVWSHRLARHRTGPVFLAVLAIVEGAFFPAPTEVLFVALWLAGNQSRPFLLSLTLGGSAAGGALGYAVGVNFGEETLLPPGLSTTVAAGWLSTVRDLYAENLLLALATSGFTPIPYFVYSISAGLSRAPFPEFLAYSFLGRVLKYSVVSLIAIIAGRSLPTRWRLILSAGLMIFTGLVLLGYLFA